MSYTLTKIMTTMAIAVIAIDFAILRISLTNAPAKGQYAAPENQAEASIKF